MDQLRFTLPEMLSLLGVFQCVYIIVYIVFRTGNYARVFIPLLYFANLGLAFFSDFAASYIAQISPYYDLIRWTAWFCGPPLSALLIIQIAQLTKLPSLADWYGLMLIPLAIIVSVLMASQTKGCTLFEDCPALMEWLNVTGLIAGTISLLRIWSHRTLFSEVMTQKAGKERYWLILALISVNIFFLAGMTQAFNDEQGLENTKILRTIVGLSFIYLVTTSLFRIYPQGLILQQARKKDEELTEEDKKLAESIENLLNLDKVYHESTYSRSDMAKELGVPEAMISKIASLYFKKTFPQMLNEKRIEDAKRLLIETDAEIKIVAQEVGFNSLPSFNRVFKDLIGQSPSEYRKNTIK